MAACRVLEDFPLSSLGKTGQGGEGLGLRVLVGQMPIASGDPFPREGGGGPGRGVNNASPFRTDFDDGTDVTVKRTGIGARGIDVLSTKVNSGSETFAYPIYDTHGNMVATLAKSGGAYALSNEQSFDVWGSVRSGSSTEDQGYCANLGHRADPESFLTYMRARYYEPMSGRFITQDSVRDGANWYVYCENDPVRFVDSTGTITEAFMFGLIVGFLIGLTQNLLQTGAFDFKSAALGALMGSFGGVAADYLNSQLQRIPQMGKIPRGLIAASGGVAAAVAAYYGVMAGQIYFELFWQDIWENFEQMIRSLGDKFREDIGID